MGEKPEDPNKPDKPDKPSHFIIHIDGKVFQISESSQTGAQLKALAGKDAQYQLFLEQKGNDPDQLIPDSQAVPLQNGMHFYTVPPATFGGIWA